MVLIFIIMLAVVYYFFLGGSDKLFNSGEKEEEPIVSTEKPAERPGEQQKLLTLSKNTAISPVLSLDQTSVWYFDIFGELYVNSVFGDSEKAFGLISKKPLDRAYWPQTGNDFIIDPEEGDLRGYEFYSAKNKKYLPLPINMEEIAWLPIGNKIVYVWRRGDGGLELKSSNPDGSDYTKITDLSGNYEIIPSPRGDIVLLVEPYLATGNKVLSVNLISGVMTELLDRGGNIGAKLSPNGTQLLFSRVNEETKLTELWFLDFTTGNYTNLGILTVPDKIVWDRTSTGFYYGLPQSTVSTDPEILSRTNDALYYYNISAGTQSEIYARQTTQIDYREMMVLSDESKLLFINRQDEKLYRLNLK